MLVVLLRHADAESDSPTGQDRDRMLSMNGRSEAEAAGETLARCLEQRGVPADRLVTSPFERCLRTAEVVGEALALLPTQDGRLACDEPLSPVVDLIKSFADDDDHRCLVLCGHNPRISELWGLLEHGPGHAREMQTLRTGEAVVLEIDRGEPVGTAKVVEVLEPVGARS